MGAPRLADLDGFARVPAVPGDLVVHETAVASLEALRGIERVGLSLVVRVCVGGARLCVFLGVFCVLFERDGCRTRDDADSHSETTCISHPIPLLLAPSFAPSCSL